MKKFLMWLFGPNSVFGFLWEPKPPVVEQPKADPVPAPAPQPSRRVVRVAYYAQLGVRRGPWSRAEQIARVPFTNHLYHFSAQDDAHSATDDPAELYTANMRETFAAVKRSGKTLTLNVNGMARPNDIEAVIASAAGIWDQVVWIDDDEPPQEWTASQMDTHARFVKRIVRDLGLPEKPYGITVRMGEEGADYVQASELGFAKIEAYIEPPKHGDGSIDVEAQADTQRWLGEMEAALSRGFSAMRTDIDLGMVAMGYRRGSGPGGWRNLETLAALQGPAFRYAAINPRVKEIDIFALYRPDVGTWHSDQQEFREKYGLVTGRGLEQEHWLLCRALPENTL